MKKEKKFLFNRHNFDEDIVLCDTEPENTQELEPEPPPPILFTEEEMLKKENAAYNRGVTEGKQQALQEHENSSQKAIDKTLNMLAIQASAFIDDNKNVQERIQSKALHLIQTILLKCVPRLQESLLLDQLLSDISEILKAQSQEQHFTITVPEELKTNFEQQLEPIRQQINAEILVQASSPPHTLDASIKWNRGGAFLEYTQISDKISEMINTALEVHGLKSHDVEDNIELNENAIDTQDAAGKTPESPNTADEMINKEDKAEHE